MIRIFLLLLISTSLFAQSNYQGDWAGDIKLPDGSRLGVVFHIAGNTTSMTCNMDVPMQGATDMKAEKIYVEKNMLHISYPNLKANYKGSMEGKMIKGIWSQNGMSLPLDLKSAEEEMAAKRPQHPKAPFEYKITDIDVDIKTKSESYKLAGTLTTPKGEGPFPLAVMVTGSGPQDRDETIFGHKPFWVIADFLSENGIAVFRYDDRGVGKSTGNFENCTTEDFTEDALHVIRNLSAVPSIDAEKIGIIGHSEGGLIASMAAAKSDKVKFAILLAGPAVNGKQILKRQLGDILKAEGVDESIIKKESQIKSDVIDIAAGSGTNQSRKENARKQLQSFYQSNFSAEQKDSIGNFETYFAANTTGLFNDWMHYFLNVEPKKYIERMSCPTLAIFGSKDQQVGLQDNLPAMQAALRAAGVEDSTVELIPDVNHLFQTSRTGKPSEYGQLGETFSRKGMILMRDWLIKRF